MTQMRLIALLTCFLAGTFGVPISPNALQKFPMGDMPAQVTPVIQSSPSGSEVLVQAHHSQPQQFQPKSPRVPSGPEQQLATLTNPWASQPNPNAGPGQLPAHFQYFPYSHPQQPQFFYYPILGPESRNPTAGPYGGLSSEELENMGRMGPVDMHMPAFRGNVFPVAGPQPFVPVNPLRPANTFHINTYPVTGMTFSTNAEVQPHSVVSVPPSGDAIPGGSHPNNGALPSRNASKQDRERVPCDHVQSAENPLTNTGPLSSGHGTFISAVLPTVQNDPHYSDPNLVPITSPTPEEALVPASPPAFRYC